jgi:hypothetical protein
MVKWVYHFIVFHRTKIVLLDFCRNTFPYTIISPMTLVIFGIFLVDLALALYKRTNLRASYYIMLIVMAKAKSRKKTGKRAKPSKVKKKGSRKKKALTVKARKGSKKSTARRKATSRSNVTKTETTSAPEAFTEIAAEEMITSYPPPPSEPAMTESTESIETTESGFTSAEDDDSNINNNNSSM